MSEARRAGMEGVGGIGGGGGEPVQCAGGVGLVIGVCQNGVGACDSAVGVFGCDWGDWPIAGGVK